MRVRTDDEVYRVDAVWLGPPKATMPWRVRYVAWGVGALVFLLVMTVERRIGVPFGWSIAWGLVATILITRLATSRITYERPLGSVLSMWARELTAPRETAAGDGGAVTASRIKVSGQRPRRKDKSRKNRNTRETARKQSGRKTPESRARGNRGRAKEDAGVRPPR